MSAPVDPFALGDNDLHDWCARERVSHAGMEALRRVAQLGTRYRWDAARRGTVVTRAGGAEHFLPHDWLERALDARDAARAVASVQQAEQAAAQPPAAPAPDATPSPARTLAPAARSVPKPPPQVEQLGLFGGRR